MGKLRVFVPMISLVLLLAGCGGGQESGAEALALAIRGEYLALSDCALTAEITADYGRRVYDFQIAAQLTGEEFTLRILQPEPAAGITARLDQSQGRLEYDGLILETGPLDDEGLSPMSALPALLEAARSGYLLDCALVQEDDEELLRVRCGDPEGNPGTGREIILWFRPESHALVRGEILSDGAAVIQCRCSEFIMSQANSG